MPSPTTKRVTAADVARSLGLSRATVGFVLNDTPGQTIPAATRNRVLAEAKRLGYRANSAAQALASGKSRIILLVLPDWPLDYSMRTHLDEASLALDEAGYSLVTMTPHPGGQARPLWETLRPDVVIGMAPFTREQLDEIRGSGVQQIIPPVAAGEEGAVGDLGFAEGPRLQVEHLLGSGRRRLAFAGSADPRITDLVTQRCELARRTLSTQTGAEFVAEATITEENAAQTLHAWMDRGVDGVVAYNDDIAAIVLSAALRSAIPVPERLAIVGHDDTPLAALLVPSLSTVRVDNAGLGRFLAELALSAATGSAPPLAGPETDAYLVVRETT
ncbi:LacI family transcriptional regulator [Microbacterium sp. 4R-513]|uniref:LacI family DNA-binding transcriptional regulator n=1 Tax=Microbacterium sp. 4R-513 TaxID=2567934 RepID=UPI0013E1F49C|nr:LacI family DNA-binding transcriptional regulator [Microbacterium sp. 4R-513]QIG38742.1 LacI family transcriptional regulator [Microbacterium sp. 4R-513]